MAAKTKTELIEITQKEYGKLQALIAACDGGAALLPDEDGVTIKDIVGHRAHWITLFLGWYVDGVAGKHVDFPAKGYKWNDLNRYNADLRAQQAGLSWPEAVDLLDGQYKLLMTFLRTHSEAQLYGGPMKGAHNNWTAGRWAEAAGASHFRSAAKYIRERRRQAAEQTVSSPAA